YTDYVGGKLFARITGSGLNQTLVLDPAAPTPYPPIINQINSYGISGLAPNGKLVFYTKPDPEHINKVSHLYSYDIATNTENKLIAMSQSAAFMFPNADEVIACVREGTPGHGFIVKYNYTAKTSVTTKFVSPVVATGLRTLTVGPGLNPKVYTGGFLNGGIGTYDPAATPAVKFTDEKGQSEGLAVLNNKLYTGLYQYAQIKSYDMLSTGLGNRKDLLDLSGDHKQDRPFAMLAIPAPVNKLVVGTVPQGGHASGALAILSLDAVSGLPAPVIKDNFVKGQSILTLTNIKNMIYGGTSAWGAFDDLPGKDENGNAETAKLFMFDISDPAKATFINPVADKQAITTLINVQGKIWGLAEDTLFIYDPDNAIDPISRHKLFDLSYAAWKIVWKAAKMVEAKN
ncbi:hypothetical protein, partial [Massilia scottii]|uniref:hypothetical protein n=1 Tax=Massilia scottii TaxID=3057166 RepID=UPI0027966CB0